MTRHLMLDNVLDLVRQTCEAFEIQIIKGVVSNNGAIRPVSRLKVAKLSNPPVFSGWLLSHHKVIDKQH